MRKLTFIHKNISTQGSPLALLKINGALTSENVLDFPKDMAIMFVPKPFKVLVDLTNVENIDIVGINFLVKLRMMSLNMGVPFAVKAPYRDNIVDHFEKTKLDRVLNVEYIIERSLAA